MIEAKRDGKAKGWTIALGLAVALLAFVDLIALRGEQVASATARLSGRDPATIEIHRVGEQHLVEISTRRRVQGESKGRAIRYRVESPSGVTVHEDSEIVARKKRFFEFVPGETGIHQFFIEENMSLLGSTTDTAHIAVYVDDRRILARLLNF
jgi:hypothetical protein